MDSKLRLELKLGIDAANIRANGGVTYLYEILRIIEIEKYGFSQVIVWSNAKTLALLDDKPWLVKENPPELNQGIFRRVLWQKFKLSRVALAIGCDVLFIPGGSYAGHFRPFVTICLNLLPFEFKELRREGLSLGTMKMLLLRWAQSRTFRKANGIIFLTEYAKRVVLDIIGPLPNDPPIIPTGLNPRFLIEPKMQRPISEYTKSRPYHLLYVSIIYHYKHQCRVVEAIWTLRKAGMPVVLDLVGPANPPDLVHLKETLTKLDPFSEWVHYYGEIPYNELHKKYSTADLGIFASSCENLPNVLVETMASGLPIACSNRGPMPELLGDAGVYFDPEKPDDIARALRELIDSPELRIRNAQRAFKHAQTFSWQKCSDKTFALLGKIALQHNASS